MEAGGRVRDPALRQKALELACAAGVEQGLSVGGHTDAPIGGEKAVNLELLLRLDKPLDA